MSIEEYIRILKAHVEAQEPNFGDGRSVLTLLYEAYNEVNTMDDARIKADFHQLYELMNGIPLRDEYSARDCAPRPLELSTHSGGIEHSRRRR